MRDEPDAQRSLAAEHGSATQIDPRGPVEVAVAVFQRADGAVLLARRPKSKVYAGYWEFPGGKVEPGETTRQALVREVQEELGVTVEKAYPWITQVFTYPHSTVRLHFFRVRKWSAEPVALEHDGISWEMPGAVGLSPVLPANGPVLKGLCLPHEYAITQAAELTRGVFLDHLERRLNNGLRLIQVREPGWDRDALAALAADVIARARPKGARVLVNGDLAVAHRVGADGVHLTSAQLRTLGERPDFALVGASCHGVEELRLASEIAADFCVLGPVRATPGHPDSAPIGWDGFAALLEGVPLPVYALGGVTRGDLDTALEQGAQGVAMIRGAWGPA